MQSRDARSPCARRRGRHRCTCALANGQHTLSNVPALLSEKCGDAGSIVIGRGHVQLPRQPRADECAQGSPRVRATDEQLFEDSAEVLPLVLVAWITHEIEW